MEFGVVSRAFLADEAMGFGDRDAEVDDEILGGERVDFVFELLEPFQIFAALFARDASALMGEIGADVTVGDDGVAGGEVGFDFWFGFEAIAGVEKSGEVGIDGVERAEIAVQKLAGEFAEEAVVTRETDLAERDFAIGESADEHVELRPFSGAVNSFEDDEFSARGHFVILKSSIG